MKTSVFHLLQSLLPLSLTRLWGKGQSRNPITSLLIASLCSPNVGLGETGRGKRKEGFLHDTDITWQRRPECGRCPNALTSQAKCFDSFLETYQEPLISRSIMGRRRSCLLDSAWVLEDVLGLYRNHSLLLVLFIGNQYSQLSLEHRRFAVVY